MKVLALFFCSLGPLFVLGSWFSVLGSLFVPLFFCSFVLCSYTVCTLPFTGTPSSVSRTSWST
ncbi:MAG TPA: hypothetical protein VGD58_23510, partial [Herpetosiphonaceae bacterium]